MSIGDSLRQARERAGLTQAELADRAGVPWRSLKNWEQGRRTPNVKALAALAAALKVKADALLGDVGTPHEGQTRGRPRKPADTPQAAAQPASPLPVADEPPAPEQPKRPRGRPRKLQDARQTPAPKRPRGRAPKDGTTP